MDIRCRLREDLNLNAIEIMSAKGYKYKKNHALSPFQQFMNLTLREVSATPRNVLVSKTLECPQEHIKGFESLIFGLQNGLHVNKYLSSNLKNAGYNDGFLNDWGLHHFHLGEKVLTSGKSTGFVERTGPILIARITNDTAYLVGIYQHGVNGVPNLWSEKSIVNVIHDEWPETLEMYKMTGVELLSQEPTAEQHANLRSLACNAAITMTDGTIYSMIGGGITTAKTNMKINWQFDNFYMRARLILQDLCTDISNNAMEHVVFPINLTLKSFWGNYIYEDKNNKILYFVSEISESRIRIITIFKGLTPSYYPNEKHLHLSKVSCAIMSQNHKIKQRVN